MFFQLIQLLTKATLVLLQQPHNSTIGLNFIILPLKPKSHRPPHVLQLIIYPTHKPIRRLQVLIHYITSFCSCVQPSCHRTHLPF
ncbi:hypothetical protein VIGAN_03189300 [Vigna angularis var. angularis]|uniref:Secreted protein n=1 Tax=Vigna angularis var. angularis TaxID=157739 RepID=A0A0S3RMZ1_PHAAN|nr:hypothetical protein VIGAN_03189300 [Vigna angularis var. angularis]